MSPSMPYLNLRITNHVERYCVRPNSGVIQPNDSVEVQGQSCPSTTNPPTSTSADQSQFSYKP